MAANPSAIVTFEARGSAPLLARAAAAFREVRNPAVLYRNASFRQAFDGLSALASDGGHGMGLLTAAPGLGKTMLRTALHSGAAAGPCCVVALESGLLGFDDMLLELLSQLRGERVPSSELPGRYDRLAALKEMLGTQIAPTGRHVLLLCDEAQQLDDAALDGIGALMNLTSERRALVVPVLVGQPALRQRLARLPLLRQRVGAQYELRALERAECVEYVEHRLRTAGIETGSVLDPELVHALHAASRGVPRMINALCRQALGVAAERGLSRANAACLDRSCARLLEPAVLADL